MTKQTLQTLKGFRDFVPSKMAIRNEAIRRLRLVFQEFGFEELQTPSLEYQEVLLGKYGKEAEKLMYLFKDPGGRDVGLRYDLTVPLARVVSQYPDLPKPFKRFQIQPAWRAENTQKGRYREFYQCDVDIVGSPSPLADSEIMTIVSRSLEALGFNDYRVRVNSRSVLFSCMKNSNIPENLWLTAIQSIDKLDKKSKEEVEKELESKGLSTQQITTLFSSLDAASPDPFLKESLQYAQKLGAKNIVFDPTVSRGLDYYTGPIFESVVDTPKIGSLTGGGRYDQLLKTLGGPDLPATGTTIGLDRVCDVIEELNLWPNVSTTSTQVLVTIFSPDLVETSISVATELRSKGITAELYPQGDARLDKQLKYADKRQIPFVLIIGPEEKNSNVIKIKNMKDGNEQILQLSEFTVQITKA